MPFLSREQRAGMIDRLKKNKKYALPVTFVGENVQGLAHVHELAEVLRAGGWQVSELSSEASTSMPGVFVGVDDLGIPNACARLLVDVLTAVGVRTQTGTSDTCWTSTLLLSHRRIRRIPPRKTVRTVF